MELINFVSETFLIVIPVLYILGVFTKNTNIIRDELIPIILTIVGILFCLAIDGLNIEAVIQGILCTGIAVLGNQYIKQFGKMKE